MTDSTSHPFEPSAEQIRAAIAFLGDDPGPLQRRARQRLLQWGQPAVPFLVEGAEAQHMATRTRCRSLLRAIEVRQLLRRFACLRLDGSGRASAPALLDGAVMAAQLVRTFVPGADEIGTHLRGVARQLRLDFGGRSLPVVARALAQQLHEQMGLGGFTDGEGHDARIDDVLLDRVLVHGVGTPVSLSLIYMLVARWAGFSVAGVALPDHFLIRLHGVRPLLLDPFHGGRVVTKLDCARYLRARGHGRRVRDHLRDLSDREVLVHYLRTLRGVSQRRHGADVHGSLGEALALLEA